MAKAVLRGPKNINFEHPVFQHPRECWDRILSSPSFEGVERADLFKLLMLYPGSDGHFNKTIHQFIKDSDMPLAVDLPVVKQICEPKSQNWDGAAIYI